MKNVWEECEEAKNIFRGGMLVDSVRALLVETLEEPPNTVDLDVEQLADEWLVR